MPKKTKRGHPFVSPSIVCCALKKEKLFWFSSLGQMIQFDTIKFCRFLLVSSCGLKKKKSHYNRRVSLHEAPTNYTCDKQVLWESAGAFFPRDNSLISRGNSHVSRVRGLVVRCLPFNPEVSCSNPWVCANFFTSIPKQKVLTFFGTMRLFGFVRLFFGFVRLFFEIF